MTTRKLLQKPQISKPKISKPKVFNPHNKCAICTRKIVDGLFITLPFSYRKNTPFNYHICGWCNVRFLEAKEGKRERWRTKIRLRLSLFVMLSPDGKAYRESNRNGVAK